MCAPLWLWTYIWFFIYSFFSANLFLFAFIFYLLHLNVVYQESLTVCALKSTIMSLISKVNLGLDYQVWLKLTNQSVVGILPGCAASLDMIQLSVSFSDQMPQSDYHGSRSQQLHITMLTQHINSTSQGYTTQTAAEHITKGRDRITQRAEITTVADHNG